MLARLFRSKAAVVSVAILLLVLIAAVAAPWLAPNDPFAIKLIQRLKPPGYTSSTGITFWLGTDSLGRDVFSRLVYGARVSLVVGLAAVLISGTIGLLVGLLSGYFGGWVDDLFMRLCDIQLSFPTILLALTIMAVLGSGLDKLILVLGLTGWVQYGRIVRSQVLTIKTDEFVLAAHATGERQWRILFQHILPNVWSPVIVIASFTVASNIVAEASLSFLGVGVPPSVPSWGTMLADGRQYVGVADWLTLPAGAAISLTVLSINILGDWLRDYLDPRLKNIA
ncbi:MULTISPECIES: ABC transporter permease [Inquilinus]|uniref:Peptide/nickel transport system permease protein n=1 Tax=Inquilinus ginsengisoli TaxID=363840 RepID=A0ABU1JR79_9PROT|nr:ABC transporter permease [Inquilinus ginsengisoli]MDR6290813.1 peptide/nickel transport system permease protein [Inquilinus ginsengisoli]